MAQTDAQGKAQLTVAPGDYTVSVQKAGYRPASQDVLGVEDGETVPVTFQLIALAGAIAVSVVDSGGAPVAGADVSAVAKP